MAAAGNDGDARLNYPAAYAEVVSVAATDNRDARAPNVGLPPSTGGRTDVRPHGAWAPTYCFEGDTALGQTTGQGSDGFGSPWWVVAPSGKAIPN